MLFRSLIISEYNSGLYLLEDNHDTNFAAAFVAHVSLCITHSGVCRGVLQFPKKNPECNSQFLISLVAFNKIVTFVELMGSCTHDAVQVFSWCVFVLPRIASLDLSFEGRRKS